MGFQENKTRHLVEVLRQDVQAMGAALAEYVEQKSSNVPKQLRGTRWPGNVFDRKLLLDVFRRNLDGRGPTFHASHSWCPHMCVRRCMQQ